MDQILLGQKLQYTTCNEGGLHQGEKMNYICLSENCKDSGIICSICRAENHKDHNVMTFKQFLVQVSQQMETNGSQILEVEEMLDSLEKIQQKNLYSLKQFVVQISESVKLLEEGLLEAYNTVRQRIIAQSFMSENMPKVLYDIINSEYNDTNALKNECKKLVESIQIQGKEIKLDFQPELALTKYDITQKQFQISINNLQKQLEESINIPMKVISESQSKSLPKLAEHPQLKFSSEMKAPNISLKENGMVACQTQTSNQDKRIALMVPALSKEGVSEFAIQVTKYMNWVGVGIGLGSVLKQKNYTFTYQQTGHGNFIISSNGYIWSSQNQNENSKNKGFQFKENDIILCRLDMTKKTLKFTKFNEQDKQFTFKDLNIPENEEIYAQVNICNTNESVKILEWKEEYSNCFKDNEPVATKPVVSKKPAHGKIPGISDWGKLSNVDSVNKNGSYSNQGYYGNLLSNDILNPSNIAFKKNDKF